MTQRTGALVVRLAVAILLLAGGVITGCCVVLVHARWWGMALGVAASVAVLAAAPGDWWRRLPLAVGWAAAVVLLSGQRREGDFLVAGDGSGYVLLGAALAVLIVGVVSLRPRRRRGATIQE